MRQSLFDFDLKRVSARTTSPEKLRTIFHLGSTTGGWHFLSYFDRETGVAKVSLAGIRYPDTSDFFGGFGILDVSADG
jgi:hypothetical protein